MIHIREISPPRKISGLTSFLVSFDYNEKTVNTMKSLPTYYYHKKDYSWEIPDNALSMALDSLTFLDDIDLTILPTENRVFSDGLTEEEKAKFKMSPFKHQLEAINFGIEKKKWLLLDSMGLGKTNEIIWTAETLKRRGLIDHCLIVCGVDSLRQNWKKEIQKFSTEDCIVLGEKVSKKGSISYTTIPERAKQLKEPIEEFFIIVNAATLRSDKFIEAFQKSANRIGMIAVDEVHKFATKTSQQGSNLLKLKSDYKIAATGTPITNSPISIYVPLTWTENDYSTLTTYKSQYCEFGGFNDSQIIGYKNLDLLKEEIDSCSLRRTLDEVRDDMPSKMVTTELVEMSDDHKKFYEAIKNGVKEEADKINLNSSNLLALTIRLRQATSCPSILTTEDITSSKVERCVELVEELYSAGEKVVVMSSFKEPVYILAKLLEKYSPLVCTGDIAETQITDNVTKFQNDPNSKILLATHQKMGTGHTLNAASYMICLDEFWTAAQNNQSFDRIWRVNNTRPAFITVLMCKDTIDERVHYVAQKKQDLSDFVIDGVENEVSDSLRAEMMSAIREL